MTILAFLFLCFLCSSAPHGSVAQSPIPASYDGFPYGAVAAGCVGSSVVVDAFFDPLCPDSRDAWPPLKEALIHYSPRLSLILHPFPLPYHDNSFASCRALHIANKLNASSTYPLMELFFEYQKRFSNARTRNMSRDSVLDEMSELGEMALGKSYSSVFRSGFDDTKTDRAARNSFKYGCSRGVIGTPYFFVNGFALPDPGYAINFEKWTSIIDPLMVEHVGSWGDLLFSSL